MFRFLFLLVGLLTTWGPLPAAAQTAEAAATLAGHRTVAILPMEVAQPKLSDVRFTIPDTLTAKRQQQQLEAKQRQEGRQVAYQMQELLYAQLLAQQPAKGYSVQFQSVAETNRRLQAAGITYDSLLNQSVALPRLARVLGVDAVLAGQVLLFQFLPRGLGLAARLLLNEPVLPNDPSGNLPTSKTGATLLLYDCRSAQLAWTFDFTRTGNNTLKPERLAPKLVKAALPVFPYCQP
ncbi:MAG: hypothetical protein EOO59_17335 [Hymenobacter sp.]|nr:MAG: hypothetical protein EOO59_17335 [Hymenobacter sp.]